MLPPPPRSRRRPQKLCLRRPLPMRLHASSDSRETEQGFPRVYQSRHALHTVCYLLSSLNVSEEKRHDLGASHASESTSARLGAAQLHQYKPFRRVPTKVSCSRPRTSEGNPYAGLGAGHVGSEQTAQVSPPPVGRGSSPPTAARTRTCSQGSSQDVVPASRTEPPAEGLQA